MTGEERGHGVGPSGKFQGVQAGRDLEANWEVDVAKKLEEYLLKICSGAFSSPEDVNFAEAALLLQGSIQVYSRKVEYLYGLVLHALDFLSSKSQLEQSEGESAQHGETTSRAALEEDSDFWAANDVPEEARNCLDASTSKDASCYHFVKPPANLVVLEGDCLDATLDGGELESFLLATNDLYRDFILLDPCDTITVDDFLKEADIGKGQHGSCRRTSARKSFISPARYSDGTLHKSFQGKNQEPHFNQSPAKDKVNMEYDTRANNNLEDDYHGFDMGGSHSDPADMGDSDSDEEDPWKPLNPHEPGNLRVKPYRKVKVFRRNSMKTEKHGSLAVLFPPARLHGTISPELTKIWEAQVSRSAKDHKFKSIPLYDKLREALVNRGPTSASTSDHAGNENDDYVHVWGAPDYGQPDDDDDEMPNSMPMDEDAPAYQEKVDNFADENNANKASGPEDPISQTSLEDLCRSHLDALLANIAETEKQTELAARVSSWKQKIEHNLEEQESRPPFDIHAYGEKILGKLSLEAETEPSMSFGDVVMGQEKHDVARSFSALLQLVNNGDVHLDRNGIHDESVCFTAGYPFRIQLQSRDNEKEAPFRVPRKRVKSPMGKGHNKVVSNKSQKERSPTRNSSLQGESVAKSSSPRCKVPMKFGKVGQVRCTPEGKRRRRSRILEAVDINSTS